MKVLKGLKEIISDAWYGLLYFVQNNLYNFGVLVSISSPYLMLYIGNYVYQVRGKHAIGGEIFVPVILGIISSLCKRVANKLNKGYEVPVYTRRFTSENDGEVTVKQEEVQEIILYLADVENYIERKGIAPWITKK